MIETLRTGPLENKLLATASMAASFKFFVTASKLLAFCFASPVDPNLRSETPPPCLGTDGNQAKYPCLPGIDAVGIGFDAVPWDSRSVGRPVVSITYNDGKHWVDPFGNRTAYAVPDQATVTGATTSDQEHDVFRTVSEMVKQQSSWARVDAKGGFFSASATTKWGNKAMQDKMAMTALSRVKVTIRIVTLDTVTNLQPHPKFIKDMAALPIVYDNATYREFIGNYGTHYVSSAEFGGEGRMKTVIANAYASQSNDIQVAAQVQISWNIFGGGGGGGTDKQVHDENWSASAQSETYTIGGDPAIGSFNSTDEWTRWAKSVETQAPAITQFYPKPVSALVNNTTIKANIDQAIEYYLAENGIPDTPAIPSNYQMGWCDCETLRFRQLLSGDPAIFVDTCTHSEIVDQSCPEGKVIVQMQSTTAHDQWNSCSGSGQGNGMRCCRPCFHLGGAFESVKKGATEFSLLV